MAGYLALGAGFGIVLQSKGYGVLYALAMSLFIYAGSMQFVAVNLITGGASLITAALTTLMVNARHLLYGISMANRNSETGKVKPYLIFALTDETYSIVVSDEKMERKDFLTVSLLDHLYWVAGSVIGSLIGGLIPWDFKGVDFALTALFLTVFTEQVLNTKDYLPAVIGVAASVISLLIFGADDFLIPAMILISLSLMVLNLLRRRARHG